MQEVLLDTSVWVRVFRGDPDIRRDALKLFDAGTARTHPWSLLELMLGQGIPPMYLRVLERTPTIEAVEDAALAPFLLHYRLQAVGIGLVDLQLLAAAHARGIGLWSTDAALVRAAAIVGLPELRPERW